jgi:transposase
MTLGTDTLLDCEDRQISSLLEEVERLRSKIARLEAENARLEAKTAQLETEKSALENEKAATDAKNKALCEENAALHRQASLDSSNSHQPPSSDGLKKKKRNRTGSLRGKSGKKSGAQPGHAGKTLQPSPTPNVIVDHFPGHCEHCGAPLTADANTPYAARQVFEMPPPPPLNVTEHRAHRCQCPVCGKETRAAFPEGAAAPVQYGPRVCTTITDLRNEHFIPEDRLAKLMGHLFNVPLSRGTVGAITCRKAENLRVVSDAIFEMVAQAPVKNLDETGCRVNGTLGWMHVATTPDLTHYRYSKKRGDVPSGFRGIVVHDHWKPYRKMENVTHALCNVHHLRELLALIEIEKEEWAARMQRVLRRACHATNLARDRQKPLKSSLIALIGRQYDRIVNDACAWHDALPPLTPKPSGKGRIPHRVGHNLAMRLRDHKDEALRFLTNPDVPFSNNGAETEVRAVKGRENVSGCSRTEEGAQDFATIRSVIGTAKKRGWNVLETLSQGAKSLINKLRGVPEDPAPVPG